MSQKRNSVAMDIPTEYESEVSELLVQLMMADNEKPVEPEPELKQEFEVTRVSSHRVTEEGIWQFKVHFKGERTGGEWINDEDCFCEKNIRDYFISVASKGQGSIKTIHCICRVSSKSQAGPNHVSLEAQEDRLIRTAREKFGTNMFTRVKIYKISASAYRGIPTVLQNIGNNATAGDAILTYRVDRLSRNIVKFLSFLEDLNERNVRIFAHDENLWYHEKKLEFIQGILDANKEAAIIGKRVKLSLERRRERGDEVFGSVPYGFKTQRGKDNRLIRIRNVVEQKVIRCIERDLSKNYRPDQIAARLNASGIKKRGRRWTAGMIKRTFESSR